MNDKSWDEMNQGKMPPRQYALKQMASALKEYQQKAANIFQRAYQEVTQGGQQNG